MFYLENNNRVNIKMGISKNVKETKDISICEEQMGLKKGNLTHILNTVCKILNDENFVTQMMDLEEKISSISAEN